ncbi:MAG: 5-formyltetrahydrofolate cyclo-ligase [Clostridium sp.]|jgi:5-formyltetrahydrofolate cyclo-ligase|nr:5-formyltetrahydrofolate cyclo-ligase [Clostridium sp.]
MTGDIRAEKNEIRAQCKRWRSKLGEQEKAALDSRIRNRVLALWQYREAKSLYSYVSGALEVDTRGIIEAAWAAGKEVAVPRCVPNTREMEFCLISSWEELEPGTFGVPEPKSACPLAVPSEESLCLVPGLSFDSSGARLGFGKGYYDRFLAAFPGRAAGLCYEGCVRPHVPCGRFDRHLPIVITEKRLLRAREDY